jgi:hypothetical protein
MRANNTILNSLSQKYDCFNSKLTALTDMTAIKISLPFSRNKASKSIFIKEGCVLCYNNNKTTTLLDMELYVAAAMKM